MSADDRLNPLASAIWAWDKAGLIDIGPIRVFLPVGLYGVYVAVFLLSVWTMYRDGKRFSGVRWVVVVTFVVVTLYMIATLLSDPLYILHTETSNMSFIRLDEVAIAWCGISACCSLSDTVLAWRCYVIFGKRRWLKWTLTIVLPVVTVSGIFYSVINTIVIWKEDDGQPVNGGGLLELWGLVEFPTTLTWAVCSLVLNTVLSTSIIAKIIIVSRQTSRHSASYLYISLARAFIESSLISWIALAVYTGLYTASDLLPNSAVVARGQNLLRTILPLIFSTSQALVIARLGISRFAASTSFKDTIVALTSDDHDASAPRSRAVAHQDVESWSDQE